jgi:hypothetical protein
MMLTKSVASLFFSVQTIASLFRASITVLRSMSTAGFLIVDRQRAYAIHLSLSYERPKVAFRGWQSIPTRERGFHGCPPSNHAMERTADRCAFAFEMTSTLSLRATRGLAWISSKAPASLVRFASSRSRTPAVLLDNGSGRSSYSR